MTEPVHETDPAHDSPTARVERALEAIEIADGVSFADVANHSALDASVDDGRAIVTVTLPLPPGALRTAVERNVVLAVQQVDGVSTVECRFDPVVPDPGQRVDLIPDVKNVIAVGSGKGGVGKSTVAVNLATALAAADTSVGLLDADVYGPNAPAMLGLGERKPNATRGDQMLPRRAHGVKVMSMGFIIDEDDPVIWRGPLVDEFLKQLFSDVEWGELDYLIVDLPPGTGDAQLSLVQHLPVTGAVIVTTPQPVAVDDARRGLRGFAQYDVPVLGVAENMATFECPDCESEHDIFDTGGAAQLSDEFDVPVLGQIPTDPAIGMLDSGDDAESPPGVSIPGIGRLQLPRTRAERERPTNLPPISVRDEGGPTRAAIELLATRTAAQINDLVLQEETSDVDAP